MATADRTLPGRPEDRGVRRRARSILLSGLAAIDKLPSVLFTRGSQMAIDALLSCMAVLIGYQLRFEGGIPVSQVPVMWFLVLCMSLVRPLAVWVFSGYDSIWRYFGLWDLRQLLVASLLPTFAASAFRLALSDTVWMAGIPRTIIVIEWSTFLLLALTARAARRLTFEWSRTLHGDMRRAIVIGTDMTLSAALRQLHSHPNTHIAGLLAPEDYMQGTSVAGCRVIGKPELLPRLLVSRHADLVVIADASLECIGAAVNTATEFGVDVRLLPSATDVIRGGVQVKTEPRAESLLVDRATIAAKPHPSLLAAFAGRNVLVTGAGGSIGSEICRQVASLPGVLSLAMFDRDENSVFELESELVSRGSGCRLVTLVGDVRDKVRLEQVFQSYLPHIVLHAAAYKHVPIMERNCSEAVLNNVVGTRMVMDAALERGAERFVMISTDKAQHPVSVMGATKRAAELLVQQRAQGNHVETRMACVRFGNVLGSRGSVVPIFLKQIAAGGPVTITHADMTRYFMTIPEAVQLVLLAATLSSRGETYMLDMGDPIKITALAEKLIEMSGLRPGKDIEIRFVGVRPGEKLHEQLWSDTASLRTTEHPRVLALEADPVPEDFDSSLRDLEGAAWAQDDELVRQHLQRLPLGFREKKLAAHA